MQIYGGYVTSAYVCIQLHGAISKDFWIISSHNINNCKSRFCASLYKPSIALSLTYTCVSDPVKVLISLQGLRNFVVFYLGLMLCIGLIVKTNLYNPLGQSGFN